MHSIRARRLLSLTTATAILATILVATSIQPSSAQTLEWVHQFGSSGTDRGRDVAVDPVSGATYVTGTVSSPLAGLASSGIWSDAFIQKLDSSGNVVWARMVASSDSDFGLGVAVDSASNVYVAGITFGAFAGLTSVGSADVFVRKLDSAGTTLWTQQFGGGSFGGSDIEFDVVADGSGLYVVSYTNAALPGQTFAGVYDAYVHAIDPTGSLRWTRQFGSSSLDAATGVTTDAAGNVHIAGYTTGALPGQSSLGQTDAFVRTYDPLGNEVRTLQFGTASAEFATAIAAHSAGVVVAGYAHGALPGETAVGNSDGFAALIGPSGTSWYSQFGSPGADRVAGVAVGGGDSLLLVGNTSGALPGFTNAGASDAFVVAADALGEVQWTRQFGNARDDLVYGAAFAGSDPVIAGSVVGALPGQTALGDYDVFVRRYSPEGVEAWTDQFGSAPNDRANAVAADADGNILVAGRAGGRLPGQPPSPSSSPNGSGFVRKLDIAGNRLWDLQLDSGGNTNEIYGLAIDQNGDVFVSGYTIGQLAGQTSQGSTDAFVARISAAGNLLWVRQFGTSGSETAYSIGIDAAGNTYAGGFTSGTLPGQASAGLNDAFVRSYDASGTERWTRQFGTPGQEFPSAGAATSNSDFFIAGGTTGAFPGESAAGGYDTFIRKYDTDGNAVWTDQIGTASSNEIPFGVATDASGNLFVALQTNKILKYPSAGAVPDWASQLDGTFSSGEPDLATDARGNAVVFNTVSSGSSEARITKIHRATGAVVWTHTLVAPATQVVYAGAVAGDRFFTAGTTDGVFPGASAGNVDAFVAYFLEPADSDGDGLNDTAEAAWAADPDDADSDDDGLNDGAEVNTHHTDPLDSDTDNDGLSDGAEVNTHSSSPTDTDTDDDGLPDDVEVSLTTRPDRADTDSDGISDMTETNGGTAVDTDGDGTIDAKDTNSDNTGALDSVEGTGDVDGDGTPNWRDANDTDGPAADPDADGLNNAGETSAGTNPNDADSDDDGLNDGPEITTHSTNPLDADTDDDALSDGAEVTTYGTIPTDADSDDDGLSDGDEVDTHNTLPRDADTDNDGLSDGAEVNSHNTSPLDADSDSDSLLDGTEVTLTTNPSTADTDGDGISDPVETNGGSAVDVDGDGTIDAKDLDSDGDFAPDSSEGTGDIDGDLIPNWRDANDSDGPAADPDGDGLNNQAETAAGTNRNDADSDDDGLTDGAEVNTHTTNPLDADTDDDGLSDSAEINTFGTNARDNDSDNDALTDGAEVNDHSTNPLDADTDDDTINDGSEVNAHGTDPNDADSDDDGLTDAQEIGTYSTLPNDADTDDDGLSDGAEITSGSNPKQGDSDGDGLLDGAEVNTYGTNPVDGDSDADTLGDGDEINIYGTDPLAADSDADTLRDDLELTLGTHPLLADSDADGLGDVIETNNGDWVDTDRDSAPDAVDVDADNDGSADSVEGTGDVDGDLIPNWRDANDADGPNADGDADGLSGAAEASAGTNPNDADSDDDGLIDGTEVLLSRTNPLDPDSDDDELTDGQELWYSVDPLVADTDADSILDGSDVEWIQAPIGSLSATAFRRPGYQNDLLAELDTVEQDVLAGDIRAALRRLQGMRRDMDGCGTKADKNDKIVDCTAQLAIRPLVEELTTNLRA